MLKYLYEVFEEMSRQGSGTAAAQEVCASLVAEIAMLERHGDSYGYEYLVLQKS